MKYFTETFTYTLLHGLKFVADYETYQEMIEDLFIRGLFPDMDNGSFYGPRAIMNLDGGDICDTEMYFPVHNADLKGRTKYSILRRTETDNVTMALINMAHSGDHTVAWLAELELHTS